MFTNSYSRRHFARFHITKYSHFCNRDFSTFVENNDRISQFFLHPISSKPQARTTTNQHVHKDRRTRAASIRSWTQGTGIETSSPEPQNHSPSLFDNQTVVVPGGAQGNHLPPGIRSNIFSQDQIRRHFCTLREPRLVSRRMYWSETG